MYLRVIVVIGVVPAEAVQVSSALDRCEETSSYDTSEPAHGFSVSRSPQKLYDLRLLLWFVHDLVVGFDDIFLRVPTSRS